MSSWKNAHKACQKPHRERDQPESRKHLGLLEKKKDYKLRADDYNAKKNELKYFQKKALDRNPDEFHYHMINSAVEDGEHREKEKSIEYTPEQLRLMQTQDYKYVLSKHTIEAKKVEKLRATHLNLAEAEAPQNKHTFFVEDKTDLRRFDLERKLGTSKSLINRRYNRLQPEKLQQIRVYSKHNASSSKAELVNSAIKDNRRADLEIQQREKRMLDLLNVVQKLQTKRVLEKMKGQIKRRIEPPTRDAAPIYEFKKERKR